MLGEAAPGAGGKSEGNVLIVILAHFPGRVAGGLLAALTRRQADGGQRSLISG
ncbi:hypothetical protein BaRGS_00007526, partial [Batillaria attramentaria]